MIICLGTTPAVQRVMVFERLAVNAVNRAVSVTQAAAGKAVNAAKAVHALGAAALPTGFVGGDRGRRLRRMLDEMGIRHDFVNVEPETRLCVTLLDRSARTHTELVEESSPVPPAAFDELAAKLQRLLSGARALVMSGTLTPGAPQDFYARCVRLAAQAGVPTVIDARGQPLLEAVGERPTVVKHNRAELLATLGISDDSAAAVREGMRLLLARGAGAVVVTMGADGALTACGDAMWRIHAPRIDAVNAVGAGDSFAAGLTVGLVDGQTLPEACRLGAACGAADAITPLAGDVNYDDVRRLLMEARCETVD